MAWANHAPTMAPSSCAATYGTNSAFGNSPRHVITALTAGLKCAPLTGPKTSINTYSPPTVASVFAISASAMLPPAKRSAMMPEPITTVSSSSVPSASAKSLRGKLMPDSRPG